MLQIDFHLMSLKFTMHYIGTEGNEKLRAITDVINVNVNFCKYFSQFGQCYKNVIIK
jgi:hypothetical protein